MLKKRLSLISTAFVLCLLLSQSIFAQMYPAVVSGRVTNGAGQGINNTKVLLIGLTSSNYYEVNTSSLGYYSATVEVPIGGEFYLVTAQKKQHNCSGFTEFILSDTPNVNINCTPW